ncbi:MAG TPA: hypothetical protein PLT00_09980 [Verrucomicrobiota bacterium]|nr:hypothetical protein [Verrucomicrobiota bacterium]HPY30598.1 hypothetical protein [Verrucomicrobiota bacterium]HQB17025.1 hypothetical protein [Verrucomicrobiota bacterium]
MRQFLAPALDFREEGGIHFAGAALGFGGFGEFIEAALEDGFAAEARVNPIPLLRVLAKGAVKNARLAGGVILVRPLPTVINRKFLKIRQDAERQFGGPRVAAELIGRRRFVLDGDGGFLGFEKKFPRAADAETVIRRLERAGDADLILVDDVLVCLRETLDIINVPAERLEEGVEELPANLGLVILAGLVGIELLLEAGDQIQNFLGRRHGGRLAARRQRVESAGWLAAAKNGGNALPPFSIPPADRRQTL